MRRTIFAMVLVIALAFPANAKLPETYKEFKAKYQTEATTYQGAVKMYFEAVFAYINEATREEAGKMLRYALRSETPIDRSQYYSTFAERLKDPSQQHIFRSFAKGSSPENNYAMDPDNFELIFAGKPQREADYLRVPLRSSGSDSLRFLWVKEFEGGIWWVINNAASYVGVKPMKKEIERKNRAFDADFDDELPAKPEPVKPKNDEPSFEFNLD